MATVNNEIIIRLNDQASAGLKNIQAQVGSTEKAFASLGAKLIGAFGAFEAGKTFISLTAGLETAKIGFTTLLGSQEKALQMMKDIDEFASKTPFEKTTLTPLVQQMIGMGFEAQKAIPTLQVLGDSMAALGRGNADLQGVVLAMGQIQTKGKLSAEELMQLAERGLPVFQILQEKLHLTQKQLGDIGKAGISSGTAINALLTGLNERFGGSMAKMSQTLTGQWSNAMDNIKSLVANSGQFLSEKIKGLLSNFNEWFDKNKSDIMATFDALFQYVGDIFDTIVTVLGTLGEVFGSVMNAITAFTQDTGKNQASVWKGLFLFIANTVATMGAVISIMIRGLSVSLGVVWNSIQIVASGIVFTIESVVAGAFWPIEKVINGVIHGINLIREVMGKTAIDTVHFSENLYSSAVDSMKQSATENGQDISNILKTASDGMASDVGNAISKIEGNFEKFNASTKSVSSSTSDLQGRINSALKSMSNLGSAGEMAGDKNTKGSKQAKEAMQKLQEQAEDAVKKITDGFNKTQKEIDSARDKLKTITEDWKKYKDEGMKALSSVNAEITKFNNETGKLKINIQSEGDQDLAKRAVEIKNRLSEISTDSGSDTGIERNKLLEEQAFINGKVSASILEQAYTYDALSQSQKIVFDNQKKMSDEIKKREEDLSVMTEKKAILELQANQKSIRDKMISTQTENGIMKAFYTDTAGKLVEIKNQENIDLALSIQAKQTELQKDYDDTNQILKKKLMLQKSHLNDLKLAYAQYHASLKDETEKMATQLIGYYDNIATSLKSLIALQKTAGVSNGVLESDSGSSGKTTPSGASTKIGNTSDLFVLPSSGNKSSGSTGSVVNISIDMKGGTYNVKDEADVKSITQSITDELTRKLQLYKVGIS